VNKPCTIVFALIWLILSAQNSHAQNTEADSIRSVIATQPSDTNKVNSLLAIAWMLRVENPSQALEYSNQAFALSSTLDFPKGKATAQSTIGVVEYRRGNLPEALRAHLQALQLREQIGDKNGVGKTYINLGNIYTDMGSTSEAMQYYREALSIFEVSGDEERVAMVCLNIGGLYLAQNENDKAKEYCNRTASIAHDLGDPLLEAQALNNSGVCYQNLGMRDSAMKCYMSSYELAESVGEYTMVIDAGVNVGNLYRLKGESASAMQWHRDMIDMSEKIGYIDALCDSYRQLSEDYVAIGDYRNAYMNYVQFKQFSDSIYNENNAQKLMELQVKYDFERKEMEIARMENELETQETALQRTRLWIVGGVVGFIVLVGVIIFAVITASNRRRDRMIIEAQQNELNRMKWNNSQKTYPGQYNQP
jgi:tetratricopeptide (TPR) repeat protein